MDIHFTADPSAFAPVLAMGKMVLIFAVITALDMCIERCCTKRTNKKNLRVDDDPKSGVS